MGCVQLRWTDSPRSGAGNGGEDAYGLKDLYIGRLEWRHGVSCTSEVLETELLAQALNVEGCGVLYDSFVSDDRSTLSSKTLRLSRDNTKTNAAIEHRMTNAWKVTLHSPQAPAIHLPTSIAGSA